MQNIRNERQRIIQEEKRRRRRVAIRRKRQLRRRFCATVIVLIFAMILIKIVAALVSIQSPKKTDTHKAKNETGTVQAMEEQETEYIIEKPVSYSYEEAVSVLKELAENDETIEQIYENRENYPKAVLSSVANNPEMAEFAAGYFTEETTVKGGINKQEKKAEYPLFIQWDERWAYVTYGDSNIGMAGCGPTCLAMAAYTLTRNEDITPDKVAAYSEANGFYVEGTGTAWALMTEAAPEFGVSAREIPLAENKMQNALDHGNVIVCAVGPGDFTTSGHFIVIYQYDEDGFYVNDPNCKYRSGKAWQFADLYGQINNLWAFEKE